MNLYDLHTNPEQFPFADTKMRELAGIPESALRSVLNAYPDLAELRRTWEEYRYGEELEISQVLYELWPVLPHLRDDIVDFIETGMDYSTIYWGFHIAYEYIDKRWLELESRYARGEYVHDGSYYIQNYLDKHNLTIDQFNTDR